MAIAMIVEPRPLESTGAGAGAGAEVATCLAVDVEDTVLAGWTAGRDARYAVRASEREIASTARVALPGLASEAVPLGFAVKALCSKATRAFAGAATGAEVNASAPAARTGDDAVSVSSGTDAVWGTDPEGAWALAPLGRPTPATRPEETAITMPPRLSAVAESPTAVEMVVEIVVVRPVRGVEGGTAAR
jgi:hypothetical protein